MAVPATTETSPSDEELEEVEVENEGPDPAPEGQEPPVDESDNQGDDDLQQTFDRAYVEKLRSESQGLRSRLREAETKVSEFEKAQMSEAERLQTDLEQEREARAAAEALLQEERIGNAIRARAAEFDFHDLEDAVERISLDSIKLTEEGRPDGRSVKAAIEALVKEKPHLVKSPAGGGGDGGPRKAPEPESPSQRVARKREEMVKAGAVPFPEMR